MAARGGHFNTPKKFLATHGLVAERDGKAQRVQTETESSCSDVESSIASADAKRSISVPWSPPLARRRKGVVHLPASHDVSAPDVEALVYKTVKDVLRTDQTDNDISDRELISQHVERVMVHADRIVVA